MPPLKHLCWCFLLSICLVSLARSAQSDKPAPWIPDLGNGNYQNPVLFADYSDPDAVRVGDDYYLVSSSFLATPGLPLLHSKDLVNWTIINHVFARQTPLEHFSRPRHGQGVWAPAIRHHNGKFWITYPDPDFGIYLTTASDPAGEWSAPVLIKAGRGLIDPCPFWDNDGQLYLIHGWAKSRAGISNLLTLHKLSADGLNLLDEGEVIIDANKIPNWNTLEGPKLYKRNGYYYVFAPSGGVATGYQAVFRSRNLRGPYENRIVLDQGKTAINGPHQGAWVDTATHEDWFLHFQDTGAYGRVIHLQPMVWQDDWPVIGSDPDGDGKGEPVLTYQKPNVGRSLPISAPQTSDDFDNPKLGLQWQWNANPQTAWASLVARPGFLRLTCQPAPAKRNDLSPSTNNLYDAPNFLLQKFPAPEFSATTKVEFKPRAVGDTAALAVFGYDYALCGVRTTDQGSKAVLITNNGADKLGTREREIASVEATSETVYLRVTVTRMDHEPWCRFSYSFDGQKFLPLGEPFKTSMDRWVGARFGLIATNAAGGDSSAYADFDWFSVTAPIAP